MFALLSHVEAADPRYRECIDFIETNAEVFRTTLKPFAVGVERDVLEFDVERLNMRQHRSKAPLYLLSLCDLEVHSIDSAAVRAAVDRFERETRMSGFERELVERLRALLAAGAS